MVGLIISASASCDFGRGAVNDGGSARLVYLYGPDQAIVEQDQS